MFALAACSASGSAASAGPAWPKAATREVDGGETLAPRAAARAIAAIVEEDRPADRAAVDKPAGAAPAVTPGAGDRPAATAPAAAPPDELSGEDIVIEIDD